MEKWMVYTKRADFDKQAAKYHISPVLARIIRNRDITEDKDIHDYLLGTIDDLYSPWLLKDMGKAVDIIIGKIRKGLPIRVIGDYDIDGICSSYILSDGLKNIGAKVDIDIPDRISDGYGINENLIKKASQEQIDTIVTCDNGIAAIEAVNYAKQLGITVVVTDHHNVPIICENGEGDFLQSGADAIINPKQKECGYPFKELCGAGVAYKLLQAIYEKTGEDQNYIRTYLEYAAIATIGDVVNLVGENRIITKYGLKLLNNTKNAGLKALIKANDLEGKRIMSYHIGFVLGPCLNSSGRLSTAKLALSLLKETDAKEAYKIAEKLKQLNDVRKEMTKEALKQAIDTIENTCIKQDKILVVYLDGCHESIAGIVAGRIKDKYHKPAIVLTKAESGVKGSGRSIEPYNMFEGLSRCKELFIKFGGHALAAGLSLKEENIIKLRECLNQDAPLSEEDLHKTIWIDVALPFQYIDENFIEELSLLEPFGKGNEKPVFAERNVKVKKMRILGKSRNVIRLELENGNNKIVTGVAFEGGENYLSYLVDKFGEQEVEKAKRGENNNISLSVTYYPQINEFNNCREVRVLLKNII